MKNLHTYIFLITSVILCWGCSDDDADNNRTQYTAFVQQALNIPYTAGEAVALIEWSTPWEISMAEDKGIITHISEVKGGSETTESNYTQIKLQYSENITAEPQTQELSLKNLKTGEVSKMTLIQETKYKKLPITLDNSVRYQHVVGFGGMYNPVIWTGSNLISDTELTKMYHPEQLGYNILRLMIYEKETNWASDVAGAKLAQEQGAIIFASPWYCPEGTTEVIKVNGKDMTHLKPSSYADFADHLVKYVNYMKNNGVNIYAISIQNEPDMEFTYWYPQEVVTFLREYTDQIKATGVKIMAPEACGMQPEYTDPVLNDPEVFGKTDIIAGHLYQGFTNIEESNYVRDRHQYICNLYNSKLVSAGKSWWMTEHLFNDGEKETDPALWEFQKWSYNMSHLAKEIHMCMEGYCSAYIYWYLKRFYGMMGDNDERCAVAPGEIMKNGYILSHYAKYASGMDRIKIDTGDSGLLATAYINPEETEITLVLLNMKNESYQAQVAVPVSVNQASAVETTEEKDMASVSVAIQDGKKEVSVPLSPNSIVSVRLAVSK